MSTLNAEAVIFWADKLKHAKPELFTDQNWDSIPQAYLATMLVPILTPQNVVENLLYPVFNDLLDGVKSELDMFDWKQQQELLSKVPTVGLDLILTDSFFNPISRIKNEDDTDLDPKFFYLNLLKDFKKTIVLSRPGDSRAILKQLVEENASILYDPDKNQRVRQVYVVDKLWVHPLFDIKDKEKGLVSVRTGINRIFSVAFQLVGIPSSEEAFACWLELMEPFFQLECQLNWK